MWGSFDDRRDIGTGNPSFETLASYTGIWRREVFIQLLGEPDEMDRFAMPSERVQDLPVSKWTRFFDSTLADVTSIILAVIAPMLWVQNGSMAIALLAVGASGQVIGYGLAAIVTYRSGTWRKWLRDDRA
jgi:hypothetical protein